MVNKFKSTLFSSFTVILCMAWTYAVPYLAQALIFEQMLDGNLALGIIASLICFLLAVAVAVITALIIKKIKPFVLLCTVERDKHKSVSHLCLRNLVDKWVQYWSIG